MGYGVGSGSGPETALNAARGNPGRWGRARPIRPRAQPTARPPDLPDEHRAYRRNSRATLCLTFCPALRSMTPVPSDRATFTA